MRVLSTASGAESSRWRRDNATAIGWCVKDWAAIQQRYLRDGLTVRLGGLAANLSRIKSFASHDANRDAVESMIDESKYFIEWMAAEVGVDIAAELVELQVQLAGWQHNWASIWTDPTQRQQMSEQLSAWSKRVLEMSGLLNRGNAPSTTTNWGRIEFVNS